MNQAQPRPVVPSPASHPAGWLLVTSEGAWYRLRADGAWRFADKALPRAQTIRPGDTAIVYLTLSGSRTSGLAAIVRFHGPPETTKTKSLFGSMYPHRAPFDIVLEAREPAPFRPLVKRLSFVGDASNYGMYLQGQALKPLTEADFRLLAGAVEDATEAGS